MEDMLIWVDENDDEIGCGNKMETHKNGIRHRAFSVFIFDWNTKKMLLQKRAENKYHSGGLWSNACCSHPLCGGELWIPQIQECMERELDLCPKFNGIQEYDPFSPPVIHETILNFVGKFEYYKKFENLTEHEIDWVFLYHPDENKIDDIIANSQEISELKWISISELEKWMKDKPEEFTAWFAKAYQYVKEYLEYEIIMNQISGFSMLNDGTIIASRKLSLD